MRTAMTDARIDTVLRDLTRVRTTLGVTLQAIKKEGGEVSIGIDLADLRPDEITDMRDELNVILGRAQRLLERISS